MLSDRVKRIGFSPTLRINAKATAMKKEGLDVIDLSVGEPDFPTPENINNAAISAIQRGFTKYTATEGITELRNAIARKYQEECGVEYKLGQVIVSPGAKYSLYLAAQALLNKNEECIIPSPYWVSYPHIVSFAKGIPVYVETREENGFLLKPEDLDRAITPNTKALILNNPSNPTGAAYDEGQLREVVDLALKEGLVIIADEIYEKLVYDGFRFTSVCQMGEKAIQNTVIINGFSKAYSMTGWRLGWAVGPPQLIEGMGKIQSHSTSNPASIVQWAGVEALNGPQYEIAKMKSEFQQRRNYMLYRTRMLNGVSCFQPQGAFYLMPNVKRYYDMEFEGLQIRNSYGLAYYLLKEAKVAIVPGAAFGADNFIRFSYATSMDNIKESMDRIASALGRLEPAKKTKVFALNNIMTKVRDYVATETNVGMEMRDALVAESDAHLDYDSYYEWNANIAGIILQLRTNSPHLNDFWMDNFYPGQLETDLEPHGVIYAVNRVPGREARAFYNSDSRTAFLFNSAFYGSVRSLALGMVADIGERMFDTHLVNAACLQVGGNGVLIFGGPGMGKSGPVFSLLEKPETKLVAYDAVLMRCSGKEAVADVPERKIYLKTKFGEKMKVLYSLFDRSRCENVPSNKDDCDSEPDGGPLDRGKAFSYTGYSNSRAIIDPYWIGGTEKHVRRTNIKKIFILHKDATAKPVETISPEKALRIIETGKTGMRAGSGADEGFFNPHLLVRTQDRIELQKRNFAKLFKAATVYYINAEIGKDRVKDLIGELAG